MSLHDDFTGMEKPDGICSLTFAVNDFSRIYLQRFIFFYQRFKTFKLSCIDQTLTS